MSAEQTACSPLDWNGEFQKLLHSLSATIHQSDKRKAQTLARYQTAIAIAGYLGPRAKELLHFTWYDIVERTEKDLYEFKTTKNRKVYYNDKLIRLAQANYKLVDPLNIHDYILEGKNKHPITTQALNKMLRKIFEDFGIKTENPSSHTLRKTFAYRLYELKGKDDNALLFVSEVLDHKSTRDTRVYLGISKREIKNSYLNIH